MIKTLIAIIFGIFISCIAFGQLDNEKSLKSELIGTWEFVELQDSNGNKVDTIFEVFPSEDPPEEDFRGWNLPYGPLLTYKSNRTYTAQHNILLDPSYGTWYFDQKKKAIIQKEYFNQPYSQSALMLIEGGVAKRDKKGDYYDLIIYKVTELSEEKMIILADHKLNALEPNGGQLIYVKRK